MHAMLTDMSLPSPEVNEGQILLILSFNYHECRNENKNENKK